jgi:hypothetical protein
MSNKKSFQFSHSRGRRTWHHPQYREEIIGAIFKFITASLLERRAALRFAMKLESLLYSRANSFDEYKNISTLKPRLRNLIRSYRNLVKSSLKGVNIDDELQNPRFELKKKTSRPKRIRKISNKPSKQRRRRVVSRYFNDNKSRKQSKFQNKKIEKPIRRRRGSRWESLIANSQSSSSIINQMSLPRPMHRLLRNKTAFLQNNNNNNNNAHSMMTSSLTQAPIITPPAIITNHSHYQGMRNRRRLYRHHHRRYCGRLSADELNQEKQQSILFVCLFLFWFVSQSTSSTNLK